MPGGDGCAPGAGNVAARARRGHADRPGDRVRGGTRLQERLAISPHPENPGVSPERPGGRPGSRVAVPLGGRCRLFSASSRHPGAGSPPHRLAWRSGGFPASRARLVGSGSDAGRQLHPRLVPAAGAFPGPGPPPALPRAGPAAPGPVLRLLFPGPGSLWPRSRVLGRSVGLGVRVTHQAARTLLQLDFPRKTPFPCCIVFPSVINT